MSCERNQRNLLDGYKGVSSDDKDMEPGCCRALYQTVINPEPRTSLLQVEHASEASSELNQRKLLGGSEEVFCDDKLY